MKIEKRDGSRERSILIGMITDKIVLGRISTKWTEGLFSSSWSNMIGSWCVDYHKKYSEAPGKSIRSIFETWSEKNQDTETIGLIDRFLSSLSDEYEQSAKENNSQHLIDVAAKYFSKIKRTKTIEMAATAQDAGDEEKAEEILASYNKVEMGRGEGVCYYNDDEAILSTFQRRENSVLIKYPGALGEFFGDSLSRDSFIAFFAPEKTGKSWWLMDMAYRAMTKRWRVAYFEVGDMSEDQLRERLAIRATKNPLKAKKLLYPKELTLKDNQIDLATEVREYKENISGAMALKACQKMRKIQINSEKPYFRYSAHPNSTINVKGIDSILDGWTQQGWIPDVVIIDYADILAPPAGKLEYRDQINTTWKQLRGLSQSRHCLVVTASQADAQSYDSNLITRRNFSEDKRKLAHVTGVVGINVNENEKSLGILRLNWVVRRSEAYQSNRCVYVASCLDLGNPAVKSIW